MVMYEYILCFAGKLLIYRPLCSADNKANFLPAVCWVGTQLKGNKKTPQPHPGWCCLLLVVYMCDERHSVRHGLTFTDHMSAAGSYITVLCKANGHREHYELS